MVAKRTALREAMAACLIVQLHLGMMGCSAPMTPGQRAREAAYEYAMAVRFGRLSLATERISALHRQDFLLHHASWGGPVRILDCELVSVALRSQGQADAVIVIGWQRADESDVRTTQVLQHWRAERGEWLLAGEERSSGDVGLLGEPRVVVQPPPGSGKAQFPSVSIGGQSP